MTDTKKTKIVESKNDIQTSSVESFISQAIEQKMPIETIERFLAMREKLMAQQAKEAFTKAMSNFQGECPVIEKTKHVMNKDGQTIRYSYAPLDAIVSQVGKFISKNGLSFSFDEDNKQDGYITAICKITHVQGHTETTSFRVPIDKDGYMSAPQKFASTLTFGKRYAFINGFGILTGDEDTDTNDVPREKKEAKKPLNVKAQIVHLLNILGIDTKDKENVKNEIKKLTKLDVTAEENLDEVRNRLEIIVNEQKENEDTNIR